jgi:hypothetical protein
LIYTQKLPERQDIIHFLNLFYLLFVLPYQAAVRSTYFPQVVDHAVMKILTFQVSSFK